MSDLLAERLARQGLSQPLPSIDAAVERLLAVQSQDLLGAMWALGLRTGATLGEVVGAYDRGEILRTHVMRPTWHLVRPSDLTWLMQATAHRVHRLSAGAHARNAIDAKLLARATEVIGRALEGVSLTREELASALGRAGIVASKERLVCLVMHAELEGVIVSGPMRGKQTTYALMSDRVPKGRAREVDEALGELTLRYFSGHGPATVHDCAWWSGLTLTEVKRGIAVAGRAIEARGEHLSAADAIRGTPIAGLGAHLLSNYDEYVIGYEDRSAFFDPRAIGKLGPPDRVLASHLVLVDGVLVGGWRRVIDRARATVELRVAKGAPKEALRRAADALGRFLSLPVALTRATP